MLRGNRIRSLRGLFDAPKLPDVSITRRSSVLPGHLGVAGYDSERGDEREEGEYPG
jgi:hypothetical protein